MDDLEDNLRKVIQMKLLSRGINPGSFEDIDLDQYSSEEDSRYAKKAINEFENDDCVWLFFIY
jgi:hypothetical protein